MTLEVSRRQFLAGFGAMGLGGAALLVKPKMAEANGSAWWETLSQTQRDLYITERAWQDNGKKFDSWSGQCKVWVQDVVRYASLAHVMLPLNNPAPYDWYWQYDPDGHAIGMSMPIENVTLGRIVQMKFKSTGIPHTVIVVGKDASGVTFLASNDPLNSYTVKTRYWKFPDFKAAVSGYAVYYIR